MKLVPRVTDLERHGSIYILLYLQHMRFVNKEKKKNTHTIPASSLLAVNITISYHLATVKQASSQIKGEKKKKLY